MQQLNFSFCTSMFLLLPGNLSAKLNCFKRLVFCDQLSIGHFSVACFYCKNLGVATHLNILHGCRLYRLVHHESRLASNTDQMVLGSLPRSLALLVHCFGKLHEKPRVLLGFAPFDVNGVAVQVGHAEVTSRQIRTPSCHCVRCRAQVLLKRNDAIELAQQSWSDLLSFFSLLIISSSVASADYLHNVGILEAHFPGHWRLPAILILVHFGHGKLHNVLQLKALGKLLVMYVINCIIDQELHHTIWSHFFAMDYKVRQGKIDELIHELQHCPRPGSVHLHG
mmetsp:Transcript_15695/g.36085  ORF Transcript_15695/g.36085 Transcript_15695/m.36085 type:complete len:281 (-) Transcript_15695:2181-3023(-)